MPILDDRRFVELLGKIKRPLPDGDWLRLIEARREFILENMGRFTLPCLGDLRCVGQGHGLHDLWTDGPAIFQLKAFRLSLGTRGIFRRSPPRFLEDFAKDFYIWGLTDNGDWITGLVNLTRSGTLKATRLHAEKVRISKLISTTKIPPPEIWAGLGRSIKEILVAMRSNMKAAEKVMEVISSQHYAMNLAVEGLEELGE